MESSRDVNVSWVSGGGRVYVSSVWRDSRGLPSIDSVPAFAMDISCKNNALLITLSSSVHFVDAKSSKGVNLSMTSRGDHHYLV